MADLNSVKDNQVYEANNNHYNHPVLTYEHHELNDANGQELSILKQIEDDHQSSHPCLDKQKTPTTEKRHQCKVCDKYFSTASYLKRHILIHTGEKPFSCKVCDVTFREAGNLKSHLRMHTGDKSYKCKVCDKSYTQSSHLTCHMRTHTGQKPYKCKVCDKGFIRSDHLKSHMRMHAGEKPFHLSPSTIYQCASSSC